MTLNDQVNDLQQQIGELQSKQQELKNQRFEENKEELLSLEWLKGQQLSFRENPYGPYGQTEYCLKGGKKPDLLKSLFSGGSNGTFTIFGDSKDYMKNVLVRSPWAEDFCEYELYTSNADTFVEFLHKADVTIHNPFGVKDRLKVYSILDEIGK